MPYPAVLETGGNDSWVEPHSAAKMGARLQITDSRTDVLLRAEFDEGREVNGRSNGSLDREFTNDLAFILAHPQPGARPAMRRWAYACGAKRN